MSTVKVNSLEPKNGTTISVPTGNLLYAPGHVIQVQQTVYSGSASTSIGNGWAAISGLNCSITPKSANSKVLIQLCVCIGQQYYQFKLRLTKGGGVLTGALGTAAGSRPQSFLTTISYDAGATGAETTYQLKCATGMYLDSPATTGTTTYGIEIGGYTTSYPVYINRSHTYQNTADYDGTPISTMTLWEIGQ